jgi:hypothetical protein
MTAPLLTVLHLIPQGVLAGLFFIMGFQALEGNGLTAKLLFLLRDAALTPAGHALRGVRRAAVWAFVLVELVGFAATFAMTQTVAAVGFPVVIFLLIPLRAMVLPRWLSRAELAVLDGPTASPFTMESVGGSFGGSPGGGGEDLVLDTPGGESGEETDREGGGKKDGMGLGPGGRGGGGGGGRVGGDRRSEEELAELGEGGGVRRRRLSALRREGSA